MLISDITLDVFSTGTVTGHNTDGWDTYRSDRLVIQNSNINNGDGKPSPPLPHPMACPS